MSQQALMHTGPHLATGRRTFQELTRPLLRSRVTALREWITNGPADSRLRPARRCKSNVPSFDTRSLEHCRLAAHLHIPGWTQASEQPSPPPLFIYKQLDDLGARADPIHSGNLSMDLERLRGRCTKCHLTTRTERCQHHHPRMPDQTTPACATVVSGKDCATGNAGRDASNTEYRIQDRNPSIRNSKRCAPGRHFRALSGLRSANTCVHCSCKRHTRAAAV
jgi:hypothetical protein